LRANRSGATLELGTLRRTLSDGTKRDIDVLPVMGPAFQPTVQDKWDEWAFTETIRFIAPDPTFYDPDQGGGALNDYADYEHLRFSYLEFPFVFGTLEQKSVAVVYEGSWFSYPGFEVVGPCSGFIIENDTTDEAIRFVSSVSEGETVTIDLSFGNKTVTSSIYGNVIGSISDDSDLATFHLAPDPEASGGVNAILFAPSGSGENTECTIYYYTRYIGI
jgi:hypothetical protein